jgi:hypothetical protein
MPRRSFRRPDLSPGRQARAAAVKEGRRPRVRWCALSLTAVSTPARSPRSKEAILPLDSQHGIYRNRGSNASQPAMRFRPSDI